MSLEDDFDSLNENIDAFVDIVHEKAKERYRVVDTSDSSDTLEGFTPEQVKNQLKQIIIDHSMIKGQNVHNQTPEDLGTLSTEEIHRHFDSRLKADSTLPISAYGDNTYLGMPVGNPNALPVRPNIMFPGAFLEMDDLGNLYIVRAMGDGIESYPYYAVLTNARDNMLENTKSTSSCIQLNSNSYIDDGRILNAVVGFDDEQIYFSTQRTNRHMQQAMYTSSRSYMPSPDPTGYKLAIGDLSPPERAGERMTCNEVSYGNVIRKTTNAIRKIHKVKARNKTFYIGYSNGFTVDVRQKRYALGRGKIEFLEEQWGIFNVVEKTWYKGFETTGLETTVTLEDNHLPIFFNYTDNGIQKIAIYVRYRVTPKNGIYDPYSFYVRLDPIVTSNGELDFSTDIFDAPTLNYDISGFSWVSEHGAPFKHQRFLRLLESHSQVSMLLETNVGFLYSANLEGSEFSLSRIRFKGTKYQFIKNMLQFENLETSIVTDTEFDFPTKEVRLSGNMITGYAGKKRVTKGINIGSDTLYMQASTYKICYDESQPGFSSMEDGKWCKTYLAYRHEMNVGDYNMFSFEGRSWTYPSKIVPDEYIAITGEEYFSNPVIGWGGSGDNPSMGNITFDRIISDTNGNIPDKHPPLKIFKPRNGDVEVTTIDPSMSQSIRDQIIPYLPANHTMFVYEMANGWAIIRYIVPTELGHECIGLLVPYVKTETDLKVTSLTLDFSLMTTMIDSLRMNVDPYGLGGNTGGIWWTPSFFNYRDDGIKRPRNYVTEAFEITRADGERFTVMSAWETDFLQWATPQGTKKAIPTMSNAHQTYPEDNTWGVMEEHVMKKIKSKYAPCLNIQRMLMGSWHGMNEKYGLDMFINIHSTAYTTNVDKTECPDFSNGGIITKMYTSFGNGKWDVRSGDFGSRVDGLQFCFGNLLRVLSGDQKYLNSYVNRINSTAKAFINGQHGELGSTVLPTNSDGWVNYGVWIENDNGNFKYSFMSAAYTPAGFELDTWRSPPAGSVYIGFFTLDANSEVVYSEVNKTFLLDGVGVNKIKRGSSIPRSGDFPDQLTKLGWS